MFILRPCHEASEVLKVPGIARHASALTVTNLQFESVEEMAGREAIAHALFLPGVALRDANQQMEEFVHKDKQDQLVSVGELQLEKRSKPHSTNGSRARQIRGQCVGKLQMPADVDEYSTLFVETGSGEIPAPAVAHPHDDVAGGPTGATGLDQFPKRFGRKFCCVM